LKLYFLKRDKINSFEISLTVKVTQLNAARLMKFETVFLVLDLAALNIHSS